MRRDPGLTYRGALQILGRHDRPGVEKLDRILGGIILGAGAGAGAAVLVGPALAPLAGFAAIWAWVEQKNEAMSLLRKLLDSISDRISGIKGYERLQLVASAHTTIVVAAFFDTLQDLLGKEAFTKLKITESEREAIITGTMRDSKQDLVDWLYGIRVPTPSSAIGFEENVVYVKDWMTALAAKMQRFLNGLASWANQPHPSFDTDFIATSASMRYRSHYMRLAADVPEFLIWASLGEHAATRASINATRSDILAALHGQKVALSRIETILGLIAGQEDQHLSLCAIMQRANQSALDRNIISESAMQSAPELTFPTLREAFVNPRYRQGQVGRGARPADENWWRAQTIREDLDLLLTAHFTAVDAVSLPLLLLGHPGAGKSLLTEVLAARLPASAYTVVRVPLRRVGAELPIYAQIQQALDQVTHGRVDWWELADESHATIRVVLLDGLDELLQAAGHRGGYLQEVVEFQQREAEQERPVVVVVTCRTVVADRLNVPADTPIVKLEDFSRSQISSWLEVWNRSNAAAIEGGRVREFPEYMAYRQEELAVQPLLLLMLALYLSDPNSPLLDADTSTADLYRQLLQNFIRREVVRNENRALRVEEAVREQFWRLSVAAFAMFNRGHQNVTDVELGMDLLALESSRESVSASPAELGQELIGQFFFVHTAEAQVPGSQGTRRSYEFMHATFSEYLIAMQTVELLTELAGTAFAGHRGLREVNDDLLFALLSHQPLPVRRAIIHFVYELVSEFEVDKRERISQLLDMLIGGYRYRRSSDLYTTYRPLAIDRVRQLAAYSANLITLRVLLVSQDGPVPVAELWPEQDQALDLWRSTVTLWWSGLDAAGWQSMLATLDVVDGVVRLVSDDEIIGGAVEARYARLIGDSDMGLRSRYGSALHDDVQYFNYGDAWSQVNVSGIVPQVAMRAAQPLGFILTQPSDDVDEREVREVLNMLAMFLKMRSRLVPHRVLKVIIEWALNLPRSPRLDPYALAAAVTASPRLVDDIPQLADPVLYGDAPGIALLFELADNDLDDVPESFVQLRHEIRTLYPETVITEDVSTEVANLLQAHRWAQSGIMDHLRIATIDGTIVIGVGAIRLPAGRKVSVVEFSGDPMDDENGRVVYSSDDNIAELK